MLHYDSSSDTNYVHSLPWLVDSTYIKPPIVPVVDPNSPSFAPASPMIGTTQPHGPIVAGSTFRVESIDLDTILLLCHNQPIPNPADVLVIAVRPGTSLESITVEELIDPRVTGMARDFLTTIVGAGKAKFNVVTFDDITSIADDGTSIIVSTDGTCSTLMTRWGGYDTLKPSTSDSGQTSRICLSFWTTLDGVLIPLYLTTLAFDYNFVSIMNLYVIQADYASFSSLGVNVSFSVYSDSEEPDGFVSYRTKAKLINGSESDTITPDVYDDMKALYLTTHTAAELDEVIVFNSGSSGGYTDTTSLVDETQYWYYVFPYVLDDLSNKIRGIGSWLSVTVKAEIIPSAPKLFQVSFNTMATLPTVDLSWSNPQISFSEVIVRRKTTGYPSSTTDGTLVYQGAAEIANDVFASSDVGKTAYYSIWAIGPLGDESTSEGSSVYIGDIGSPRRVSGLGLKEQNINGMMRHLLTWTNPQSFEKLILVNKEGTSVPTTPTPATEEEGVVLYEGKYDNFVRDFGNTIISTSYSYGIFVYDKYGNYTIPTFETGDAVVAEITIKQEMPPPSAVWTSGISLVEGPAVMVYWENPDNPPKYSSVVVVRSEAKYPTSDTDGSVLGRVLIPPVIDKGEDIGGLTPGGVYYYSVMYDDGTGTLGTPGHATFRAPGAAADLGPIIGFSATSNGRSDIPAIELLWGAATSPSVDKIVIVRKVGMTSPSSLSDGTVILEGKYLSYSDKSVVGGTIYSYSAFNSDAYGNMSSPSTATVVAGDQDAPSKPLGVYAKIEKATNKVIVGWTNPTSPDMKGIVIVRKDGGSPPSSPEDGIVILKKNYPKKADSVDSPVIKLGTVIGFSAVYHSLPLPIGIELSWGAATSPSVDKVIIVRKVGMIAPSSLTDGTVVANVEAKYLYFPDISVMRETIYSYSAFNSDVDRNLSLPSTCTVIASSTYVILNGDIVKI
jgi:hypothetical protein